MTDLLSIDLTYRYGHSSSVQYGRHDQQLVFPIVDSNELSLEKHDLLQSDLNQLHQQLMTAKESFENGI